MTDKEKARAYDDALEIAKNEINIKGIGETVELCERLFPELREGEDERIRKVIYKLMLGMRKEIFTSQDEIVTKDKALAYLEKQKEQKPVEWNKKPCLTCQEYKKGFEAGRLEGVTAGYNKAVKEMEQKPAEWSEEDKRKLNRIYEILGYAADDKGFLTSKRIIGDKEAIELQDFLKSLRPSWKPSEEQEVDLEKETKSWILNECGPSDFSPFADHWCADDIMATARHFFELGKNSK